MDTNDKSGATPGPGQAEKGTQNRPAAGAGPRRAQPPKMDGVSAGGRPQRPVPRTGPAPNQKPAGPQTGKQRPQRPAQSPAENGAQRPQKPPRKAPGESGTAAGVRQPQSPAPQPQAGKPAAAPRQGEPAQTRQAQRPQRTGEPAQQRRRTGERPAGTKEPARKPTPADSRKKKQADTAVRSRGDSGYQPYRGANERKKAQRSSNLRAFFSDQNPVLRWFERVRYNKDSFAEDSDLAKQRRARRQAEEEKRRRRQNRFNTPAVIYTQPAAFNRDRLIVQLISVLTVVVALMVGLSIFFKVGRITVSGAEVYQPWSIVEASGISKGDNLLTLSRARATSQILANLPYVKKVRIGIKLPDTVNIEIEEGNVAYAIKDDQGTWWLMDSDAKVTEMINNSVAGNYTQVLGLTLSAPKVGDIGVPTEIQAETVETEPGEETMPTVAPIVVTGAERMAVAQQILKALEANDIVGSAASVDVTQVDDIVLWYGSRYQVMLGDSTNLSYKIACMYDAILQMSDYQTGILDVSFTQWENQVALTPFE